MLVAKVYETDYGNGTEIMIKGAWPVQWWGVLCTVSSSLTWDSVQRSSEYWRENVFLLFLISPSVIHRNNIAQRERIRRIERPLQPRLQLTLKVIMNLQNSYFHSVVLMKTPKYMIQVNPLYPETWIIVLYLKRTPLMVDTTSSNPPLIMNSIDYPVWPLSYRRPYPGAHGLDSIHGERTKYKNTVRNNIGRWRLKTFVVELCFIRYKSKTVRND